MERTERAVPGRTSPDHVRDVLFGPAPVRPWRIRFGAWMPVPLFFVLIVAFHQFLPSDPYESVLIGLVSNIVFSTVGALLVVYLVAIGFLKSGSPALLFLCCGVMAWSGSSIFALHFGGHDPNQSVTIHNLGAVLAGACHLVGGLLIGRRGWVIKKVGMVLPLGLAGTLCAMAVIVLVSRTHFLPDFFVPHEGGTLGRQLVIGAAITMFGSAAALLAFRAPQRPSAFDRWYALALALVAVGLFGVMLEKNVGDAVSWMSRAAQALSGLYMLVAALVGLRESNLLTVSLQATLHESEQRFRALAMAGSDAVFRMSPDWREMRMVVWGGRRAGRQPNRAWLQSYVHPDDRDAVLEAVRRAMACRSSFDVEHRVLRSGDRVGWVLSRVVPIRDQHGEVIEWFGTATDISERKRAEAEREKLMDELRETQGRLADELDAMTRLQRLGARLPREAGLNLVLEEVLEAAVAISKADFGNIQILEPSSNRLKIVASRGCADWWLRYWESGRAGRAPCGSALQSGERIVVEDVETSAIFVGTVDLEMQRLAGVRACQSTPLIGRSGKVLGVFTTHYRSPGRPGERALRLLDLLARQARDIIEAVQANEALRAANACLVESDQRKNEFLAALSHELRNPLAPISNSLFILDHAPAESEQADRAKRILARQVGQLSALVNDLLDVTRVSRNKIQLNKERLDLNEAVGLALEDNRWYFERADVRWEFLPAGEPVHVLADRTRMAQIVGNLLHNAAKFSSPGGYTRIALGRDGVHAILRVSDDGVGIDSRTLQHLFEPFMQAEQSLDRSQGGLGLGLALVKGLVELHGGSVAAHSDGPGQGTELVVRLPLEVEEGARPATPEARSVNPRRRVLIVEDNVDAANSLCEALSFSDHQVEVAYTGVDGIAKAERQRPDVILCDIGLPLMDGYQVAQALRSNKDLAGVYLVALSGYTLPEDRERALAAGFDRHLAKPPSLETLEQVLLESSPSA